MRALPIEVRRIAPMSAATDARASETMNNDQAKWIADSFEVVGVLGVLEHQHHAKALAKHKRQNHNVRRATHPVSGKSRRGSPA